MNAPPSDTPMIVDAHVHLFPDAVLRDRGTFLARDPAFAILYGDPSARTVDADAMIEAMNKDGVDTAVVCGFPWRDTGIARMHNDAILAAARSHPGRIVGLAAVDPLAADAPAEAQRALAAGAAGLGEIGVYLRDLAEPEVRQGVGRLAGLCAEADRPLLLHTNEPVGHRYPGKSPMTLAGLYDLVREHPNTRFQLAHLGGGLFFYELLKKEAARVLSGCVYDTAAAPYLYESDLYPVFVRLAGPDRLLYGSDFPLLRLARYRKDVDGSGLGPEEQEKLFALNARAFWRL